MLIIDRIEEDFAVCELVVSKNEETEIILDIKKLPQGAKAGDVLAREGEKYVVDEEETRLRREKITRLQNSLWD